MKCHAHKEIIPLLCSCCCSSVKLYNLKAKETDREQSKGQKMRQTVNTVKCWSGSDVGMCTVVQRSRESKGGGAEATRR